GRRLALGPGGVRPAIFPDLLAATAHQGRAQLIRNTGDHQYPNVKQIELKVRIVNQQAPHGSSPLLGSTFRACGSIRAIGFAGSSIQPAQSASSGRGPMLYAPAM